MLTIADLRASNNLLTESNYSDTVMQSKIDAAVAYFNEVTNREWVEKTSEIKFFGTGTSCKPLPYHDVTRIDIADSEGNAVLGEYIEGAYHLTSDVFVRGDVYTLTIVQQVAEVEKYMVEQAFADYVAYLLMKSTSKMSDRVLSTVNPSGATERLAYASEKYATSLPEVNAVLANFTKPQIWVVG